MGLQEVRKEFEFFKWQIKVKEFTSQRCFAAMIKKKKGYRVVSLSLLRYTHQTYVISAELVF